MDIKNENSIICEKYGPLVDIDEHIHKIFHLFRTVDHIENERIYNWFLIASGLNKIDYYSGKFDSSSLWCRPAYEYELEKSLFHEKLILEITRFNFVWSGFEAFVDSLKLNPCPKQRGKINAVNHFLKETYLLKFPPINFYLELVEFLKRLISTHTWYGRVGDLFSINSCTNNDLIGLKVVYQIRNLFAHGDFTFSEPEEFNEIKPMDVSIIQTSTRIVLLTLQMLVLSTNKNRRKIIPMDDDFDFYYLSIYKYCSNLHIKGLQK